MRDIALFVSGNLLLLSSLAFSSDDQWFDESGVGVVSRTDHTDGYWCKSESSCRDIDVPGYGSAIVGPQHAIGTMSGVSYRFFDADDKLTASVHFITTDSLCATIDDCFKFIETALDWKSGRLVESTQSFSERQMDGYQVRHTLSTAGDFNVIVIWRPGEFDVHGLEVLDPQSILDRWQSESDERNASVRAAQAAVLQAQLDHIREMTLTQDDFQSIKQGMTMDQVSKVLRRRPDQLSSETGSAQVWLWSQHEGFGMILVTFGNGRVVSKSQVGIY